MSTATAQNEEAAPRPVASPAEGETLIKHLLEVMDALLGTVEEETALVRAGKLAEAAKLEAVKTELSGMYVADTARIRASQVYLNQRHAGAGGGVAQASRPVPRGAANESDRARHRARRVGEHHARRLLGARPQGDAAGLWRLRPRRSAVGGKHATFDVESRAVEFCLFNSGSRGDE